MSNCEMSLFKKDTDAIATNRGFLYQYLKTLNTWIKNYIEGKDIEIYCETEDDIKELDLINSIVRFTQVKCYSTSFSLKSEDIQKSIFNFFVLYSEYDCEYSGEFLFITNSKISRNSVLLDKWAMSEGDPKGELLRELVIEIRQILMTFILKEKDSQVKKYGDMVVTRESKMTKDPSSNAKIQKSIDELLEKIEYIKTQYQKALGYIEKDDIIENFISKIRWQFDELSAEESIEILKKENIELITSIKEIECFPTIMESRLLTEVFNKSSQTLVENRILTNQLFNSILKESEEEIYKKADGVLVAIYYRFDSLEGKMDKMIENLKNTEIERFEYKKKDYSRLILQTYEDEEIEKLIDGEEKENQSNLIRKISNIGLGSDTDFLIDIATNNRCSYLLYLEELRLNGRTHEYQLVKSLEKKVRRICFTQVRKNQEKDQFDSHEFWLEFQKTLNGEREIYSRNKEVEIDDEIVFAQMYQIAAECPLRWHKE